MGGHARREEECQPVPKNLAACPAPAADPASAHPPPVRGVHVSGRKGGWWEAGRKAQRES